MLAGVAALTGAVTGSAGKVKPSFYLVAKDDRMIPPPTQRDMAKRAGATVTETKGSHAVYVSKPKVVANFIEQAANQKSVLLRPPHPHSKSSRPRGACLTKSLPAKSRPHIGILIQL